MADKFYKIGPWIPNDAKATIEKWCENFAVGYGETKKTYWQEAYASMERFASDKDLEDFWKKCPTPEKIADAVGFLFIHYDIFKPETDRESFRTKIDQIINNLKAISDLMKNYRSIDGAVKLALGDAIAQNFFKSKIGYLNVPDKFIDDLIKKIEGWAADPYKWFGRNLNDARAAERTFFVRKFAEVYKESFGKVNNTHIATILSVIRADLGEFHLTQVRRYLQNE